MIAPEVGAKATPKRSALCIDLTHEARDLRGLVTIKPKY